MDREETKKIVRKIKEVYNNKFTINNPKELVDTWHEFLVDYDYDEIMNNLKEHVKSNKFAPAISDLIKQKEQREAIPSLEETKEMLARLEGYRENATKNPQKYIDEMRRVIQNKKRG